MIAYVESLSRVKPAERVEVLRRCFPYLSHDEEEIARDALAEFERATHQDIRNVAKKLPADEIRRRIRDTETSQRAFGYYALLLGNAGQPADAELLRGALHRFLVGIPPPRLLVGYALLAPREAWPTFRVLVEDASLDDAVRLSIYWQAKNSNSTIPRRFPIPTFAELCLL
jgi:hypothetical protein